MGILRRKKLCKYSLSSQAFKGIKNWTQSGMLNSASTVSVWRLWDRLGNRFVVFQRWREHEVLQLALVEAGHLEQVGAQLHSCTAALEQQI